MALSPTKEGTIPFNISSIETPCFTYYKIFGDISSGSPPVVILHGGPGAGHEYLLTFAQLWPRYGLPVVFYDQIGCASSTHLPQTAGHQSFWQESLFIAELDNLLDTLKLRDGRGFHLLGQSWGGRLAAAYATSRPQGLRRLILASGLASTELAMRGRQLRIAQLPADAGKALVEGELNGDRQNPAYLDALALMNRTFLCRTDPFPPDEMKMAMKHRSDDKTVEHTMYGPSPGKITGSLRGWTCIPRLPNITATTLVYNGEYDTSHDVATAPFFEHIPRVRWITFGNAGHMPHLEGEDLRERVLEVVGEFLIQEEASEGH